MPLERTLTSALISATPSPKHVSNPILESGRGGAMGRKGREGPAGEGCGRSRRGITEALMKGIREGPSVGHILPDTRRKEIFDHVQGNS